MKDRKGEKEANNTVKDGIHIQIPEEQVDLTDAAKSGGEMWEAGQSKSLRSPMQ